MTDQSNNRMFGTDSAASLHFAIHEQLGGGLAAFKTALFLRVPSSAWF